MALEYINCAWFIVLLNQFSHNLLWYKLNILKKENGERGLSKVTG